MNSSVWRDVRGRDGGRSRSGDVIVGLCDGNRIWRVSPDMSPDRCMVIYMDDIMNFSNDLDVLEKLDKDIL